MRSASRPRFARERSSSASLFTSSSCAWVMIGFMVFDGLESDCLSLGNGLGVPGGGPAGQPPACGGTGGDGRRGLAKPRGSQGAVAPAVRTPFLSLFLILERGGLKVVKSGR